MVICTLMEAHGTTCVFSERTSIDFITVRTRSCGKVVFLHLSFCSQGGVPQHALGRHPPADLPPPPATAVDGTHPTGMHSCLSFFLFATFRFRLLGWGGKTVPKSTVQPVLQGQIKAKVIQVPRNPQEHLQRKAHKRRLVVNVYQT